MSKVYTAQEMREFADAISGDLCDNVHRSVEYTYNDLIPVIDSLRQAADLLEREAAKDAEIARLRALVKGLLDASSISCADCKYDCYSDHSNCIIHDAANYIEEIEVK